MRWPSLNFTWWRSEQKKPYWFVPFLGLEGVRSEKENHWVWSKWSSFSGRSPKEDTDGSLCMGCICLWAPVYLLMLSIFGIVASIQDMIETHYRGLPACDWRRVVPETNSSMLRSAKLVSSGLYVAVYITLFLGVFKSLPDFLVPYLVVQLVTILLATLNILVVGIRRRCALRPVMFIQLLFMLINWLQCYCHHYAMTSKRDLYCRKPS